MITSVAAPEPTRLQLSRRKGWRMPPNTVNVARPTMFGNPWHVEKDGDAQHCIDEYRRLLTGVPVKAWPTNEQEAERAVRFVDATQARAMFARQKPRLLVSDRSAVPCRRAARDRE